MTITAAEIESGGDVLRLTITGSLTSPNTNFGAYTLDPSGTPRLVLTSSHPGFVKSGGQAVSGTFARNLVGLLPLRLPVNPASPTVKVLDETDLGGGSIRVRLALSEHIYATDTGLSLSVLAGWRTGAPAQSGLSVTNNSTCAAPLPIMRWVLEPYGVTAGSFRVSLLVFSHHPVGFEPVAGVKFTATDGTNTKTVWTLQLDTDNSYGDNLRCYTTIIDPGTAPALTTGLLRVDGEVYPWLGSMRTTDPAGTRSMSTLRTDGFAVSAESPWVIGYDPAGTRYGQMWTYVDPVNGTTTASAAMIATTLAGAKAIAPASRPATTRVAEQAGYLFNRTLAAANGQASATRSVDGMFVVLAPGTHSGGGTNSPTAGVQAVEVPMRIIGDPDNADPRNNCIFAAGTGTATLRLGRIQFENLTMEAGGTAIANNSSIICRNMTLRGKSGQEGNATGWFTSAAISGQWSVGVFGSRFWRHGSNLAASSSRVGPTRAVEHSRQIGSHLLAVKNRLIGNVEDSFVGTGVLPAIYGGWPSPTLAGQCEDIIVAYNDLRFLRGRAWNPTSLAAAAAGTPNPSLRRTVVFGNVMERIGNTVEPFFALGEDSDATMSYNIIEANTFAGERVNTLYSDPPVTTVADTNTKKNQAFVNRVANNAFDWMPTKHDDFFDSATATVRGSSDGFRPQMTEAWSMLFAVGHEGNYDAGRTGADNFPLMTYGVRSTKVIGGAPNYASDGSILGPGGAGATGGGNYLPLAGSPLLGRVIKGNSDRDFVGNARITNGAAGAFELPASGPEVSAAGVSGGAIAFAAARAAAASLAAVAGAGILFTVLPNLTVVAGITGGTTLSAPVLRGVAITVSADAGGGATVSLESSRPTVLVTGVAVSVGAATAAPAIRGLVHSPAVANGGSIGASVLAVASGLMTADLPPSRILKSAAVKTITFGRGGRPS